MMKANSTTAAIDKPTRAPKLKNRDRKRDRLNSLHVDHVDIKMPNKTI